MCLSASGEFSGNRNIGFLTMSAEKDSVAIEKLHFRIPVTKNESLHAFVTKPVGRSSPIIITIHGTAGSGAGGRRWRIRLGQALAKRGFAAVNFDHRGCGYSDGEFEETTVTKRIEDLHAIINFPEIVNTDKIGFFGFSLGSAVAVLHQLKYRCAKTAVLYTLPCDMAKNYKKWFEDRMDISINEWLITGRAFIDGEFYRTDFLHDLPNHDVFKSIKNVAIPLLLIQPTQDNEVKKNISFKCFKVAPNKDNKIVLINGTHSFDDNEAQEQEVLRLAEEWFESKIK